MGRLLLVSNRLPVTVRLEHNRLTVVRSMGGLATGLAGPHERSGGVWIGWPGETSRLTAAQQAELERKLAELRAVPMYLSSSEVRRYYEGFSNGVLWPMFHYQCDRVPMGASDWEAYRRVNQKFADLTAAQYRPGDTIWVQDYQLALVPGMLRARLPDARIGYFLHIPFPSVEVFRMLPWREPILAGLLGADLIGFHALSYVRHFANALLHTLGVVTDVDRVRHQGRVIHLGAFPMGVDAAEFDRLASSPEGLAEVEALRRESAGRRLLLGVDRLDYTKGIPRRLAALERLLEREPSLRGKVRLIQLAVPSRENVADYAAYRHEVNELVGRINGAYGSVTSVPVHYLFRSFGPRRLAAMYRAADVMLVTPLRDGMNLVAKEFVACRADDDGVLVLSELAGAAAELGEALLVNPYDVGGMASTLSRALAMPREERRARMRALRRRVLTYDVHRWANDFLEELERAGRRFSAPEQTCSDPRDVEAAVSRLRGARRVVWLLDYDGTLVPFARLPELAAPDAELRALLAALAAAPGHEVHVVSGRLRGDLERWLGDLPVGLHAEHGMWSRLAGEAAWTMTRSVPLDWKERVRGVLEQFVARTPGTFIEEKTASLAWHWRAGDPEFAPRQAHELQLHVKQTFSEAPIQVLPGDKVVEIRAWGVNKGLIPERLAERAAGALVVALGDDVTDEDLFQGAGPDALTVHVGPRESCAGLRLRDVEAARQLLRAALEDAPAQPALH